MVHLEVPFGFYFGTEVKNQIRRDILAQGY